MLVGVVVALEPDLASLDIGGLGVCDLAGRVGWMIAEPVVWRETSMVGVNVPAAEGESEQRRLWPAVVVRLIGVAAVVFGGFPGSRCLPSWLASRFSLLLIRAIPEPHGGG
jgi:hypothetical protein